MEKQKRIAGWILAAGVSVMLLISGISKFFSQELVDNFIRYNLDSWREVIAIGEIASALLFLIPKTNNIGTLLLSSFWGGTIVVHMTQSEPFYLQIALLIITWATYYIRQLQIKKT